jgi:hypothetical protein
MNFAERHRLILRLSGNYDVFCGVQNSDVFWFKKLPNGDVGSMADTGPTEAESDGSILNADDV